jgi:cupin 2 domain-containing protein
MEAIEYPQRRLIFGVILVQTEQLRIERVILLHGQATVSYGDGRKVLLKAGDYLLIVAHEKHRMEQTSADPPCIW